LVAVTNTSNVEPTSAGTNEYVAAVSPSIETQFAPVLSQRCH
jgi:hypothetical protein